MAKASAGLAPVQRLSAFLQAVHPANLAHAFQREALCVAVFGAAAFYLVALWSFSPLDPSLTARVLERLRTRPQQDELAALTEQEHRILDGLRDSAVPVPDPATRGIPVIIATSKDLDEDERSKLAAHTSAIVSKDKLSREVAISRISEALSKALPNRALARR